MGKMVGCKGRGGDGGGRNSVSSEQGWGERGLVRKISSGWGRFVGGQVVCRGMGINNRLRQNFFVFHFCREICFWNVDRRRQDTVKNDKKTL